METPHVIPVVLSGGSGTRLWPVSRQETPKQLEALVSDRTMLGETLARLDGLPDVDPPIVVCNADHAAPVQRILRQQRLAGTVVLEPVARNTAAAVAAAAIVADQDAVLLVMPADHVITDVAAFQRATTTGAAAAVDGSLVTFGIVPTHPATGYGYIRSEGDAADGEPRPVAEFVEKPDEDTAQQFLASGDYLWNSGMFMFRAATFLDELKRHAPQIASAVAASVTRSERTPGTVHLDEAAFAKSPSTSIDYAVMEQTDRAVVVPLDAGWSDVGSWTSLHEVLSTDDAGNVIIGDVMLHDVTNSYLRSDGRLLAAVGLDGIVAVTTPDAVLIASGDRVEDVKSIVERLRDLARPEADRASRRSTESGSFEALRRIDSTSIDLLTVDPGATMTPGEGTWVVASGTGRHGTRPIQAGDVLSAPVADGDLTADEHPLHLVRVHQLPSEG